MVAHEIENLHDSTNNLIFGFIMHEKSLVVIFSDKKNAHCVFELLAEEYKYVCKRAGSILSVFAMLSHRNIGAIVFETDELDFDITNSILLIKEINPGIPLIVLSQRKSLEVENKFGHAGIYLFYEVDDNFLSLFGTVMPVT